MDTMIEELLNHSDEKDSPIHLHEKEIEGKKSKKIYKQIRPKVNGEWSHEDIVKLITAVEQRPTLWDISSPQYKLPKTVAWQEIADSFGERTADECKAKWSNLRVTFKTNLSKSKRQKSGAAAGGFIVWKYFNSMMFLDVNETSQTTESISSMVVEDSDVITTEPDLPSSSQHKRIKTTCSTSIPMVSKNDTFKEMAANALSTIAKRSNERDQFDAFGTYVAAELRSLPSTKSILAKRKMARALVDIMEEMHNMPFNTTITYVDEIEILKKIFVNLNELKSGLEKCNSRFEEYQKNVETSSVYNLSLFDIRYDTFPEKCKTSKLPKTCEEATFCTKRSGIYKILFEKYHPTEPLLVECDFNTDGGGWLLIQRRQDGSVDFYRNWSEYKKGFGNIDGEFFIGLDKLHALTNYNGPQELLIILEENNETKFAKYNNFVIGNESEQYALKHLGAYEGNAGDSLLHHVGGKFSTKDRDNDASDDSCAVLYTGAWWYKNCHVSNLNGKFGDTTYAKGITWHSFRGYNVSVRHVKMMIRRRRF